MTGKYTYLKVLLPNISCLFPAPLTGSDNPFYFGGPFDSHVSDRRCVMAFKIEGSARGSALDPFQIAFAVGGPDRGFPANDFIHIGALPPANDDVARIVAGPHAVALDLESNCIRRDRKRNFDFIQTLGRDLFKFRLDFGACPDPPGNLRGIAGGWIPNPLEQPGRRGFQDRGKRHQGFGRDPAPVVVFDGALQIANRVRPFGCERGGMRGKAHGPQAAFDPGENVFKFHTGRVTEHAQECIK